MTLVGYWVLALAAAFSLPDNCRKDYKLSSQWNPGMGGKGRHQQADYERVACGCSVDNQRQIDVCTAREPVLTFVFEA